MNDFIVVCNNLRKTYTTSAESLDILCGLDFELSKGVSAAITGASGSGKSTLLSIIGGLDRPSSGSVRVAGFQLNSLQEKELPLFRLKTAGFIFQFHYLLKDLDALENVALPAMMAGSSARQAKDRARELLSSLGLGNRATHYPSQLSGGERQRVAIARALVNSPSILLADEPTGNLDRANADSIGDLLFNLPSCYGTTLLLVTHDTMLASRADRICRIENGLLDGAVMKEDSTSVPALLKKDFLSP